MSSNGGAQKEQRKQKNLEAKRKQLENARSYSGILKAMKYMVPLPADNGYGFKVHGSSTKMCSPLAVTPGTRRSFIFPTWKGALDYLESNGFDTENHVFPVDEAQLARSHAKEDGWTPEAGQLALEVYLKAPKEIVVCLPELTHRKELQVWPPAQVKSGFGSTGVRLPCPTCRENEFTHYICLHQFTIHGLSKAKVGINCVMCCCNPDCSAVKNTIEEARAASKGVTLSTPSQQNSIIKQARRQRNLRRVRGVQSYLTHQVRNHLSIRRTKTSVVVCTTMSSGATPKLQWHS